MKKVILIPTYNEKENIAALIPKIFSFMPDAFVTVIDDRSPDGTGEAVRGLQAEYSNVYLMQRDKKEGLGRAYSDAIVHTLKDPNVDIICTMDADLSHNPSYLPVMTDKIKDCDMVIGSRYVDGGGITDWGKFRRRLSSFGNIYFRRLTGLPVMDSTSGYACIRADALRKLSVADLNPTGYAFQCQLKYRLWKQGAKLFEIPIKFCERKIGKSKISLPIILEGITMPWHLLWGKK